MNNDSYNELCKRIKESLIDWRMNNGKFDRDELSNALKEINRFNAGKKIETENKITKYLEKNVLQKMSDDGVFVHPDALSYMFDTFKNFNHPGRPKIAEKKTDDESLQLIIDAENAINSKYINTQKYNYSFMKTDLMTSYGIRIKNGCIKAEDLAELLTFTADAAKKGVSFFIKELSFNRITGICDIEINTIVKDGIVFDIINDIVLEIAHRNITKFSIAGEEYHGYKCACSSCNKKYKEIPDYKVYTLKEAYQCYVKNGDSYKTLSDKRLLLKKKK